MNQKNSRAPASKIPTAKSSLVRRLVRARNDPAKQRIRTWLKEADDQRLLNFGLTREDIFILRRARASGIR